MAGSVACVAETVLEHRPRVQEPDCGSFSQITIPFHAVKLASYTQIHTSLQALTDSEQYACFMMCAVRCIVHGHACVSIDFHLMRIASPLDYHQATLLYSHAYQCVCNREVCG